ncbi:MAG: hypothetical protein ACRDPA_29895, partial [Solirubrobacteraceae bacterium]
ADPVAPNTNQNGSDNPAGRALNRRVTIVYAVKAPAPPTPPPVAAPPQSTGSSGLSTSYAVSESPTSSSTYQVTVDRFYRDGALAVLELTARCTGFNSSVSTSGCDGEFDWGGSTTVPPQTSRETGAASRDASGIYVTDPATGTDYIPVRDSKQFVMTAGTSPTMPKAFTYPLWLYFPAPPTGTSTVNVLLPGAAASINGVPVAAEPASP